MIEQQNDTEDLELEIQDDPATGEPSAEPAVGAEREVAKDGVEELRASLEAERKGKAEEAERRRAAEERANRAEQEANTNRGQVQTGHVQQLTSAIELLQTKQANTKRDLSLAWQAGDFDRAADLQAEIAEQAAYLTQLKQGRENLEAQAKRPQAQPQPRRLDPVEALAQQVAASGSPRSAEWIRKHPEVATDQAMHNEMLAAHHRAVRANLAPDSDAYFKFVEDRLGLGDAGSAAEPMSAAAAAPQRRAPVAAAPVSRGDGGAVNGSKTQIKLTRGQLEAGRMMGLTDQEIAAGAAKLAREQGKLQ